MKSYIKTVIKQLVSLSVFAAGFGYIEGAVAYYLRIHFYPDGFGFNINLKAIDNYTLAVEMGREFATLIIIAAVAMLSRGGKSRKFSNFIYVFGIWDIFYYITLYVVSGWPDSIVSWDVLFLLPVPWFGPVLAPVILSVTGIIWAGFVNIFEEKNGKVNCNRWIIVFIIAGLGISLGSFVIDSPADRFPQSYHWDFFMISMFLLIIGFGWFVNLNKKARSAGL